MREEQDNINEQSLDGVSFPVLTDRYTRQGKRRRIRYVLISLGSFLLVTLVFFLFFRAFQSYGRARLDENAASHGSPDITSLQEDISRMGYGDEYIELPEGQLIYDGKVYEYNTDIMTFLIVGIDSRDGIGEAKVPGGGGQADMIIMVVLDEETKSLKVINISRDIMVPVQTFDFGGFYTGYHEKQIALQYAYGDGRERSLRLMEEVVSELFYGIPIHGSGAMDWFTIEKLNDAVGGVTVTVLEDLTIRSPNLVLGNTVTLMGRDAFHYNQYRNTDISESNNLRIARQKQYMLAFYQKVRERTKENLLFPLRLYDIVNDNVVTGVSASQVAYLSTAVPGTSFSEKDMVSVAGEVTQPGIYEEFRVNEEKLLELIIGIFYREVR